MFVVSGRFEQWVLFDFAPRILRIVQTVGEPKTLKFLDALLIWDQDYRPGTRKESLYVWKFSVDVWTNAAWSKDFLRQYISYQRKSPSTKLVFFSMKFSKKFLNMTFLSFTKRDYTNFLWNFLFMNILGFTGGADVGCSRLAVPCHIKLSHWFQKMCFFALLFGITRPQF